MEEESNGELAFLDTLLKRNNGEISVLVYRKPTHTDQYLHYSSHHQTSCKESVASSLFDIVKRTHLEHFFHHVNNLHQNIKFTMEEESNGELDQY